MSKAMKKLAGVLAVGVLALGIALVHSGKAYAYTDAILSNNTAQITITITPNVDRSVTISTANVNMDLGLVNLTGSFVSTQTVSPATVTVGGTIGNTDLELSGNIVGGWNFESDSTTLNTDNIATWVTFTSISSATAPSQDAEYFNGTAAGAGSDLLAAGAPATSVPSKRVGVSAVTGGEFENFVTNMNNMVVNTQRHMWMFFRMPGATSTTNAQKITFVLTVDQGL